MSHFLISHFRSNYISLFFDTYEVLRDLYHLCVCVCMCVAKNNRFFDKLLSSVRAFVNSGMNIQIRQKRIILLVAEGLLSSSEALYPMELEKYSFILYLPKVNSRNRTKCDHSSDLEPETRM
jgi:hypothetical protein